MCRLSKKYLFRLSATKIGEENQAFCNIMNNYKLATKRTFGKIVANGQLIAIIFPLKFLFNYLDVF